MAMLRDLVPVDDATILFYPATDLPVVEYFEVPAASGRSTLDRFIKGAFLLDPFYLAATRDRRFGLFRLRDLAPRGFRESEYYRSWYRNCGYQDECGFLIPTSKQGFINIALGKTTPRTRFSAAQLGLLQDIEETVRVLCQRHWQPVEREPDGVELRTRMNDALTAFGSSLLTRRERQVINLILRGHSTRTLAEKLNISTETVKLHRKHAYAKLEVSSQAELFYLFLDSLMSSQDYSGGDTLEAYFRPPPKG